MAVLKIDVAKQANNASSVVTAYNEFPTDKKGKTVRNKRSFSVPNENVDSFVASYKKKETATGVGMGLLALFGGFVGTMCGFLIAKNPKTSLTDAELIVTSGVFGLIAGAFASLLPEKIAEKILLKKYRSSELK